MVDPLSVDAHVLISKSTPKEWVDRCLESIHMAARFASFKVNVFTLSGVEGHIGQGRAQGYALGCSPYVTYIDDDDYLVEEAFHDVAPALVESPDAVFPGEYIIHGSKITKCLRRHHLPFYRREHLIDHSLWRVSGDPRQIYALGDKNIIEVKIPLYCYRIYHHSPASRVTQEHPEEWEELPPVGIILKSFADQTTLE